MRAAAVLAVLCAVSATPTLAEVPESVPRLALDVANPRRSNRRILHIEDLIGPRARALAGPRKALLVVTLTAGTQQKEGAGLAELAEAAEQLEAADGMLIAVVIPGPTAADDPPLDAEAQPFVVVRDTFGLARRRLGLVGPGHAIVIRSDGRIAGAFGPGPGGLGRARDTALALLKEER